MARGRILVVDDNSGIRSALKLFLPDHFSDVETLPSPKELMSTIATFRPDAVLLDMNFVSDINTGNEGLYWLSEIKAHYPEVKVVLFTAYADISLAVEGMKRGAFDFIVKPWENAKLVRTLSEAVYASRRNSGKRVPERSSAAVYWGSGEAMRQVRATLDRIAPTDACVLITGENGTGKDVVASYIHSISARRNGPYVAVDLGAVTDTLFESEMFGHVRGAFTGAVSDHEGKFGAADGGTLFLDEIGNIPLHLQAKLLRALQNRSVARVGGKEEIPFDIRLICATNRNIGEMVAEGSFREDLFYRINTIHINLPPLRERPDEIIPLGNLFIGEFSQRYNRRDIVLDDDAAAKLLTHQWPGNIRELRNCIENAVIMSEGGVIRQGDIHFSNATARVPQDGGGDTLAMAEEKAIRDALERFGGNLSMVAKALKISRPTLYAKLKKYGI